MPNGVNWMGFVGKAGDWKEEIEDDARNVHFTHRVILEKPTSIVIYRPPTDTTLAAQTVRIEQTRIQPDRETGKAAREHRANATLLGYKGHPTITDTDINAHDQFIVNGIKYEVRLIFPDTPGRVEAWLEVIE
jgi:hypothetical protein